MLVHLVVPGGPKVIVACGLLSSRVELAVEGVSSLRSVFRVWVESGVEVVVVVVLESSCECVVGAREFRPTSVDRLVEACGQCSAHVVRVFFGRLSVAAEWRVAIAVVA